MVSIMDEALELEAGHKVLEIGAGSGWHAATVAEIVAPSDVPVEKWGHVYTVEIVRDLASLARGNLRKAGYEDRVNLRKAGYEDRVTVMCGDGSKGYVKEAPYHRILVTAAAPQVPKPLTEQLRNGGVLVIPVGGTYFFQSLLRIRREDEHLSEENLGGVAFVPLTGEHGHRL